MASSVASAQDILFFDGHLKALPSKMGSYVLYMVWKYDIATTYTYEKTYNPEGKLILERNYITFEGEENTQYFDFNGEILNGSVFDGKYST